MTTALPTGQRGQVLALAVTAVPLLALWLGVAAPLIDHAQERAARLAERGQLAGRMALVAADLPKLKERAAALAKTAQPAAIRTLDGESDAVAAATLQNRVQEMAAAAGASLTSVEILEAAAAGDYRRIGLKLSLNAPWPVLVGLMQALERSPLPLVIDNVQIRHSPAGNGRTLDAAFTVTAFRGAAARTAAAAEKKP